MTNKINHIFLSNIMLVIDSESKRQESNKLFFQKLTADELTITASSADDAKKRIQEFGYPKIIAYHLHTINATEIYKLIKLKEIYSLSTFIVTSRLPIKLIKSFCLSANIDCYTQYSISTEYIHAIVGQYLQINSSDSQETEPEHFYGLSIRQTQILKLVNDGHSNIIISKQLNIATGTVKQHLTRINKVLNTKSRAQAVFIATQKGLI